MPVQAGEKEMEDEEDEELRSRLQSMSQKELESFLEDYMRMDFEDVVGGIKVRCFWLWLSDEKMWERRNCDNRLFFFWFFKNSFVRIRAPEMSSQVRCGEKGRNSLESNMK